MSNSVLRFSFLEFSALNIKFVLLFFFVRFWSFLICNDKNFPFHWWLFKVIHKLSLTHDFLFTTIFSRLCLWNCDLRNNKTSDIFSLHLFLSCLPYCFSLHLVNFLFLFHFTFRNLLILFVYLLHRSLVA